MYFCLVEIMTIIIIYIPGRIVFSPDIGLVSVVTPPPPTPHPCSSSKSSQTIHS